eukprot:2254111-Pyramimonas_sp.AAC.1
MPPVSASRTRTPEVGTSAPPHGSSLAGRRLPASATRATPTTAARRLWACDFIVAGSARDSARLECLGKNACGSGDPSTVA